VTKLTSQQDQRFENKLGTIFVTNHQKKLAKQHLADELKQVYEIGFVDGFDDAMGNTELNKPEQLDWKKVEDWEKKFSKEFTDNILPGGYGNDLIISKEAVEPLMDFISEVEHQAIINERERTVREVIKLIKKYFDEHEKANSSFTMYDLLIKFIKELL